MPTGEITNNYLDFETSRFMGSREIRLAASSSFLTNKPKEYRRSHKHNVECQINVNWFMHTAKQWSSGAVRLSDMDISHNVKKQFHDFS